MLDGISKFEISVLEGRLWVEVIGYPSLALSAAHELAKHFIEPLGPWHFTTIVFTPPWERGFTDLRHDSEWQLRAVAALKSNSQRGGEEHAGRFSRSKISHLP